MTCDGNMRLKLIKKFLDSIMQHAVVAFSIHAFYIHCNLFYSAGKSCGEPTTNRRIRIMGRSFLYRDRVVYMCPPGQNPTTSPVLTCGQDGKWDKVPGCQGLTISLYNMIRAWITARVTKVNTFPVVCFLLMYSS